MNNSAPNAPFPYFGAKSMIARDVWQRFGDVENYIEPFFGSGALLLGAPWPSKRIETINDIDAHVANFWRAMAAEPDRLAAGVDWPVNEVCLTARHRWLCESTRKREHAERMKADPDYYDVKIAAWWCWGLCQWIGAGWCTGEWFGPDDPRNTGTGINVRDPERGGRRPHLGDAGIGVHRLAAPPLADWFRALSDRLRRVRVCCGDWSRICTDAPTVRQGLTAVFLDPPYSAEAGRDNDIYVHESGTVAHDIREWAIERGDDPMFRIALCGYEGERLMPDNWECFVWKANGGYAHIYKGESAGKTNCHRERIWFSPQCRREQRLF